MPDSTLFIDQALRLAPTVPTYRKFKLLISAYACAPNHGSEHAVGWNWITEAHRQGHEVSALVAPNHREAIEAARDRDPSLKGIRWYFPEVRFWPLEQNVEPIKERTYNLLWQRVALRCAQLINRHEEFCVVHHLTWGGLRAPTLLGRIKAPLVIGPLGGGETSPQGLRDAFSFKNRMIETARDLSTATVTLNPIIRSGFNRAAMIAVRTKETRETLSQKMQRKSITFGELTLSESDIGEPRQPSWKPPRILFAGRLLYWKGVHIALRAFAEFAKSNPGARLTIVGNGPEEDRLRADAATLGIAGQVDFIPRIPQDKLFDLYRSHDLLLFPSLHDSGGTVILEAMARGTPVMCLDLGGPGYLVTPESGVVVSTAGQNTSAVAKAMAGELTALFADPAQWAYLSRGAINRAREFTLSERVRQFYGHVADHLSHTGPYPREASARRS